MDNGCFLFIRNSPSHNALETKVFLARNGIRTFPDFLDSRNFALADFFFSFKVKSALSGVHLKGSSVKTEWERATGDIPAEEFMVAFTKWFHRFSDS